MPHCSLPPPSISSGFLPYQEPAAPWGFLEGGDLPLQGRLRVGTLTLGAESCFPFPPASVSSWHSRRDGFPSSRKTAAAGHCDPSRLRGGPGGCWALAGPASTAPEGGVGASQHMAPSLIGTKNAKGQGLLPAPIPFHGPAAAWPGAGGLVNSLPGTLLSQHPAGAGTATTRPGGKWPPVGDGPWPGHVLPSHSCTSPCRLKSRPQG